ncbi:subtype B tannase, partial [Neisseria sp. P0017.S005]
YMPADPGNTALEGKSGETQERPKSPYAALTSLSKRFVVAAPGARGRNESTGKSTAAIVYL